MDILKELKRLKIKTYRQPTGIIVPITDQTKALMRRSIVPQPSKITVIKKDGKKIFYHIPK